MELDPEQIETAHDAALRAARQHQLPQPTHAFEYERQQSLASTLRLIGHPATDPDVVVPLGDRSLDRATASDDSSQEMLGVLEADTTLPMAPSACPKRRVCAAPPDDSALTASAIPDSFALSSDFDLPALSADVAAEVSPSAIDSEDVPLGSVTARPDREVPSGAAPGGESFFSESNDSSAFVPADSPAAPAAFPRHLMREQANWTYQHQHLISIGPIPRPTASCNREFRFRRRGQSAFGGGGKSLADRLEVGAQSEAGREGSTVNDEQKNADGARPSHTATAGGDSSVLTVVVTLDDRDELVARNPPGRRGAGRERSPVHSRPNARRADFRTKRAGMSAVVTA